MSDAALQRFLNGLIQLAYAALSDAPPPTDSPPPPEPPEPPKLTEDMLRSSLESYMKANSIDAGVALLESFGARKISDIKDDDYAAFYARTREV